MNFLQPFYKKENIIRNRTEKVNFMQTKKRKKKKREGFYGTNVAH